MQHGYPSQLLTGFLLLSGWALPLTSMAQKDTLTSKKIIVQIQRDSLQGPLPQITSLDSLLRISIEAAMEGMEAGMTTLEQTLDIEVLADDASGRVTIVSGAGDAQVLKSERQILILSGTDTIQVIREDWEESNSDPEAEGLEWDLDGFDDGIHLNLDLPSNPSIRRPGHTGHWHGIGFGTVLLTQRTTEGEPTSLTLSNPAPLDLETSRFLGAWNLQFNPFAYRQPIIGEVVGVTTGLGMDWYRLQVAQQTVLNFDGTNPITTATDTLAQVKRNHLSFGYLRVPLLLSFRTQDAVEDALHLEVGIIGGVRLFNNYMRKYSNDGVKYVDQIKGINMNPLQCNGRITAGYGGFSVFAEFPLRPLWDGNGQVETPIYPVTFGIRLGGDGDSAP
jgi:hypothetical protein